MNHKVLIIGGGFGGLHAAKALQDAAADVILLDRRNYHLFQPLLYQVATGGLSGSDIASSIRGILRRQRNVRVVLDEAVGFDFRRCQVETPQRKLSYDTLIVAAGAVHDYFGNEEWRQSAPALKTLEDANRIRQRVLRAFEAAELETDNDAIRREWLTFVVVGAGPTGVELAGALAEISRDTLRGDFRNIEPKDANIQLIDMAPRVLPGFQSKLSDRAERRLVQLGVRPRTGVKVKSIDAQGVTISTESGDLRIASRTVLWGAGVKAAPLSRALANAAGAKTDKSGRLEVEPDCSLAGHPNVFVIGDMAAYRAPDGRYLPGLAPVAMQQGDYVGRVIKKRLRGQEAKPFRYVDKGMLATIGRKSAVASFGGLHFNGVLAWLAWLFVHLLYLVGFQNRVLVATQWAFHYFTYNRKARIIVEESLDESAGGAEKPQPRALKREDEDAEAHGA